MKRMLVIATTLALVATLGGTSPAQAQEWPVDCLFTDGEELQTVTIDPQTLQIRVNPEGVAPDVDLIATGARDLSDCLSGGIDLPTLNCLIAKLQEIRESLQRGDLRYVYQDPYTGEVVVDGGRLRDDLTTCLFVTV